MMRRGDETVDEERARFKESRRFCKAVEEILGGPPDIVFEHVGKATFPTSVLCVKPFGKVVICGATSGYQLDFDVRYLWMRQKEIIGSHFANAWEATKANELIEESKIRPVLWQTMGFESVAEAHQLLRDNKHLGKIAILVGATEEGQGKTAEGPGAIRAEVGCLMAWPGSIHDPPWYATVLRKDSFAPRSPAWHRSRCATAPPSTRFTAPATTATRSRRCPGSRPRRTGTATGTGRR